MSFLVWKKKQPRKYKCIVGSVGFEKRKTAFL